jgi:hypothetical protein
MAEWAVKTFGLRGVANTCVLDVAGGKGLLSHAMVCLGITEAVLVDPWAGEGRAEHSEHTEHTEHTLTTVLGEERLTVPEFETIGVDDGGDDVDKSELKHCTGGGDGGGGVDDGALDNVSIELHHNAVDIGDCGGDKYSNNGGKIDISNEGGTVRVCRMTLDQALATGYTLEHLYSILVTHCNTLWQQGRC